MQPRYLSLKELYQRYWDFWRLLQSRTNLFQRRRRVILGGCFYFQNIEEIIYRTSVNYTFQELVWSLFKPQFCKRTRETHTYIFKIGLLKVDMKIYYFIAVLMAVGVAETYISPQDFTKLAQSGREAKMYSKVFTMGKTVNNNQLQIFTVAKFPYQELSQLHAKQAILIDSYMHAREPYSLLLLFNLYSNLIHHQITPSLAHFLETGVIIFYPFVNADGFREYYKQGAKQQTIRKNFNLNNHKCQYGNAGVDINRNFESSFGSVASSRNPCNQQYRGESPFSEKQAQVFKEIFSKFKVVLAIDIHSYGNEWIYPYASDTSQLKIKNHPLNKLYNEVVARFRNNNYKIQSCFQSLGYIADGVYIDWALDQGAFSLAYEVGKKFTEDSNITYQIQKSLKEFDTLFEFLEPKIVGQQIGSNIVLTSKSMVPLKVNISFGKSYLQGTLNAGQSSSFVIPGKSTWVKIYVGKDVILSSKLDEISQPIDSNLVISIVLVTLTVLYFLMYKLGKVDQDDTKKGQLRSTEYKDAIQISYEYVQQRSNSLAEQHKR